MQSIEELHSNAMNIAEEAFIARRRGDNGKADALFREALDLENKAAENLPLSIDSEPTRSVLFRSAASLAYNVKDYELADRLIAMGLSGYPPEDIKSELKNLYEDVNFLRHLKTKGRILDKNEWLLTLAGNAVRYGGTEADYLMVRVDRLSSLFYRTVERLLQLPYRISGGVDKEIKRMYGLFINAFSPASFAVSFQVGTPDPQLVLPWGEESQEVSPELVVDEMMNCFEIIESDEPLKLKERIVDEEYYGNFVGLAKQIAPDGKNISLVGFTSIRDGVDRPVALRKIRKDIRKDLQEIEATKEGESKTTFSYSGILMHANTPLRGKFGTVKLLEKESREKLNFKVPISIMKDVVQPYYEESVNIQGYEKGGENYLDEISPESDE